MSRRGKFTPEAVAGIRLEERVVLTGGGTTLGGSVLLRAFHTPVRAPRASVSTLVGLAYDSFQQDFNQVRAVYLNSVQAGTAVPTDTTAFTTYIGQRTALLSQQVANSFLTTPGGAGKHQSNSVLPVLAMKINGDTGSLKASLISSTPASNASATTIAVDTVAQDDAIETSQVNTMNAVTIVRNGYFGTSKGRH